MPPSRLFSYIIAMVSSSRVWGLARGQSSAYDDIAPALLVKHGVCHDGLVDRVVILDLANERETDLILVMNVVEALRTSSSAQSDTSRVLRAYKAKHRLAVDIGEITKLARHDVRLQDLGGGVDFHPWAAQSARPAKVQRKVELT